MAPNCLNTYYKCIFHHKKLFKMTCYILGKSISALVLKSFPHAMLIWRVFLWQFIKFCHEIQTFVDNSILHKKTRQISAGWETLCKLERNFQHWLATNKTLGNVFRYTTYSNQMPTYFCNQSFYAEKKLQNLKF